MNSATNEIWLCLLLPWKSLSGQKDLSPQGWCYAATFIKPACSECLMLVSKCECLFHALWLASISVCLFCTVGWWIDMIRVSEGMTGRPLKPKSSPRSTLTSVLQYLGEPLVRSELSPLSCTSQITVNLLSFQSPVQQLMFNGLTAPLAYRCSLHDACFPLFPVMAHLECWENEATITTAGLNLQKGGPVLQDKVGLLLKWKLGSF